MTQPSINPELAKLYDCLYRISVKAIILDGGKVYMVHELDENWWGLPGGGIDYDEGILEALKRELHEELGVAQKDITIKGDVVHVTVGGVVDGIPRACLFYQVALPKDKLQPTDHVITGKWFEPSELKDFTLSPSLIDIQPVIDRLLS